MKKISVIIPCYNVARWIDRCMTSIAAQTMGIECLEIICIDDASSDGTWEHLQKWEQSFPEQIILIRQEVNRRQGAARNLGLQYASADWIAFVDADDWLEPDYFEQLYTPAENYICDVVTCGWMKDSSEVLEYLKEEDRGKGEGQYIQSNTKERKKEMLLGKPLGGTAWAKIIRKELLLKHQICFPEGLMYEDNYWVPLLHIYADNIYVAEKKLYHWFMHAASTVHAENELHHIDRITVQMLKWDDYRKRGLLQIYREELEYDLLYYALCFMQTLAFRYDSPSFSLYQLEREVVCERISDHIMDFYEDIFSGIDKICFHALRYPLDKDGFLAFVEKAKAYYGLNGGGSKRQVCKEQRLRIIQFYSETESFHFFTDRLTEELEKRGHEVFICDLDDLSSQTEHSCDHLNQFLLNKVDMVICFDGIGTREEQFIRQWDKHQAVVADILMDPPFRFHPTLEKHPENYMLFCCDEEHVAYVKKYFSEEVPNVAFMPHVGTLPGEDRVVIPYKDRKHDILFSGSYYHPQSQMEKIRDLFPDQPDMWRFYQQMLENLIKDSSLTIEKAVLVTLQQFNLIVSDEMLKMLLNRSLYVDWAIRMYHRGRVVTALAEAGLELCLIGPGWENHPSAGRSNVRWLDTQVPYRETLMYMADARINLNVMPWFKAGTHDRIFNTLLQRSLPLTDPSSWITKHFTDGVDIVLYDLNHLEQLPGIASRLLAEPVRAEAIIQKGYEKVRESLTWSNCADWLLEAAGLIREHGGQEM